MNTVTYYSINVNPAEAWLAFIILSDGSRLNIVFSADTEQKAVEKAVNFYETEKNKQKAIVGSSKPEEDTEASKSGRGQHFAGKAWLIHEVTRQKIRVPHAEVNDYLSKGYIRGGPRSK